MATKLQEALRERFKDPREVLRALGLDEDILDKGTSMTAKPTKFANLALQLTAAYVKPLLAKDAKIDLMPVFAGVTRKNFKPAEIKIALDAALKGKLAKDAEPGMGHVAQMLDHIEHMTSPQADESVSQEQHNAMEAAAHGESNLGIPKKVGEEFEKADRGKTFDAEPFKAFLKEKGVSDADINTACDMVFKKTGMDAEGDLKAAEAEGKRDEAELATKEAKDAEMKAAEEKKAAEDKAARDAEMKNMVTKDEMTKAVKAAVETERANGRAVAEAREFVRPYVGELAAGLALDSAEGVLRHTAKMLKISNAEKINVDGLRAIIELQPKIGARPPVRDGGADGDGLAMDAATAKRLSEKFPGIEHIIVGGA
jgi:hypothetical protein